MNNKPKRQLTEEQLEKLAKAREKANEVRRKNYEIKKFERENIKHEKVRLILKLILIHHGHRNYKLNVILLRQGKSPAFFPQKQDNTEYRNLIFLSLSRSVWLCLTLKHMAGFKGISTLS